MGESPEHRGGQGATGGGGVKHVTHTRYWPFDNRLTVTGGLKVSTRIMNQPCGSALMEVLTRLGRSIKGSEEKRVIVSKVPLRTNLNGQEHEGDVSRRSSPIISLLC